MRRRVWWVIGGALFIFCFYRLATFTPQPLDSANTLRPFFNRLFISFLRLYQQPETAYRHWRVFCLVAALVPPVLALLNYFRRNATGFLSSRFLFFASIAFSLFVSRYPILLDFQLNPDEGEFLSAAHKLFYDGNFFHSVDCGTTGPLNIYPLMLPAIFGISPDYASTRVIVLLLIFSTVYLLYRSLTLLTADRVARIAVLPLAAVYANFRHPNLVHYSSEHMSLLLVSLGLYLTVRVLRKPAEYAWPVSWLGVLTTAAFFAKMQAVPMLAVEGAVAIGYVFFTKAAVNKWRPSLLFVAGLLPLLVLNLVLCLIGGVWKDFLTTYLLSNQRYVEYGNGFFVELPGFLRYLVGTLELRSFLITALIVSIAFACFFVVYRKRTGTSSWRDPIRWLFILSILLMGAATYGIYKPHRAFPHYLLFLFTPVACLMAAMLIRQTRVIFPVVFLAVCLFQQVWLWKQQDEHHFRNVVTTIRTPEGDFIRALTRPGEHIFVWGWTADPFLGSGRVTPTRDLNLFYFFIGPPEITNYYRDRFLRSVRAYPPEMFVDAVGQTSWSFFDRARYNFEQFPDIARFVDTTYVHLTDAYGQRYFLRRDLQSRAASVPMPRQCAPNALACVDRPIIEFIPEAPARLAMPVLPAIELPAHAAIEADFTPEGLQTRDATIFQDEAVPGSLRGFRLQSIGDDRYRLILGLGSRWAFSKSFLLPPGKPAVVLLNFDDKVVYVRVNGVSVDDMHLASPPMNTGGPIDIGSWLYSYCQFSGKINFFQVLDGDRST